ncbi:hypothetical protein H0H87_011994 [Tephrocybe sp. NHM501043]|nr:hypothetical protein H0H87_011994 [Tephrocybe sp. NHM501043]
MVIDRAYHPGGDDAVWQMWSGQTRENSPLPHLQSLCPQIRPPLSRINQCVGLHNERHFVLFMAYLVLSTFCFSVLGYQQIIPALGITMIEWEHRVPQLAYIIIYLLSAVLCLAVGIMLSYHVWSISWGETTVEGQDHEVYTRKAKSRGEVGALPAP